MPPKASVKRLAHLIHALILFAKQNISDQLVAFLMYGGHRTMTSDAKGSLKRLRPVKAVCRLGVFHGFIITENLI